MTSYKIEFTETQRYVFDVQAENEQEARARGYEEWHKAVEMGMVHYFAIGDADTEISTVYDVTGSDDDAFLEETCRHCDVRHSDGVMHTCPDNQ